MCDKNQPILSVFKQRITGQITIHINKSTVFQARDPFPKNTKK